MTNNETLASFTHRMAEMTIARLIRDGMTIDKMTDADVTAAARAMYPGAQIPAAGELQEMCNKSTRVVLRYGLSEVGALQFGLFAAANIARYLYSCEPEATHEAVAERMDRMYWTLERRDRRRWLPLIAEQEQCRKTTETEKQLLDELYGMLQEETAWRQYQAQTEGPLSRSGRRRAEAVKRSEVQHEPTAAPVQPAVEKPAAPPPAEPQPAELQPAQTQDGDEVHAETECVRMNPRESKLLARVEAQLVMVDLMVYLSENGTEVKAEDDGKRFFMQICREMAAYRNYGDEEIEMLYSNLTDAEHALMDCGGFITDTIDKQIAIIELLCLQVGMAKAPVADLPLRDLANRALETMQTFKLRYDRDRLSGSLRRMADRTYGFGASVPASVIARFHQARTLEKLEILCELYQQELEENQNLNNQEFMRALEEQRAGDEMMRQQVEQRRMIGMFSDLCIRGRGGTLGDLAMGAYGCYSEVQLRVSLRALLQQLEKHGLKPYGLEWMDAPVVATADMAGRCIDELGAAVIPGECYTLKQPGWIYNEECLFNAIMMPVK